MKRVLLFSVFLLCLCACSEEEHAKEHLASDGNPAPAYMLYSPNGEPLNGGVLGKPSCKQALGGWFDHLSANSDGHIPLPLFLQDAQTQFARMDIDHNGYLVSEELDRFRAPYRQPDAAKEAEKPKTQHKYKGKDEYGHSDPSLSMSDPVMSADTNLDFKVTPEEFTKQAQDIFTKLDTHHDGTISRAEVLTLCDIKQP